MGSDASGDPVGAGAKASSLRLRFFDQVSSSFVNSVNGESDVESGDILFCNCASTSGNHGQQCGKRRVMLLPRDVVHLVVDEVDDVKRKAKTAAHQVRRSETWWSIYTV